MHLIGQKILKILCMLNNIFPATEIYKCRAMLPIYLGTSSSTICQVWSIWLSWIWTNSALCSICIIQVSFHEYPLSLLICCSSVAYLSSCFGNSKLVTECEPKPIAMNFGSSRREEGGSSCVEGMVQDCIGQKKFWDNFSNNILLIFAEINIWVELCCQSTMEHLS